MLRHVTHLKGMSLSALDGDIGKVKDVYFDDLNWAIRHLVADTGKWLPGVQVLISPFAVNGIRFDAGAIDVDLTRKQIEDSPRIEEDKPVSAQMEERYYQYYGWPYYWQGPLMWGPYGYPRTFSPPAVYDPGTDVPRRPDGDRHLRSAKAVGGYSIQALDEEFGHVEDFVFDEEDWAIRHILIDTRNWWPGKKVLLPREWISDIDWEGSKIHVDLDRETVKRAPEYQAGHLVTREYEEKLFRFYNREPYWAHAYPTRIDAPGTAALP